MNESTKTICYAVAALLVAIAAIASQPRDAEPVGMLLDLPGEPLFANFEDPDVAARLRIVEFDEEVGRLRQFEVKRDRRGAWVIPSHGDYPADANEQMRDASLMFVGKKILDYSSTVRGEHAMFGVVEPNEEMTASAEGVGVKVILEDADGNELANLIIGKKVKNEPGRRFVRRTSTTSDIVLIAEIDPTKLSTKFENWIATDLLQLNAFDIDGVTLKDYSLSRSAGGYRPIQRLQVDAAFDSTTGIWSLNEMLTYTAEGAVPTELLDDEELNAEALDSLRKALDDLKIVNVARKPDGLSADLTLGENFLNKQESIDDLIGKGFHADTIAKKLYSANGEAHISMKGGVRYVLRFGGTSSTRDEAGQLHRFLFVTAEVDYSKLPSPQLIELPTAKPGEDKDELAARRSQIAKENERKVAEWEGKKRAAEDRVRALQARFGPWYYVISEDVYRDIHLGRNDLIAESRGENNLGYGVDDFRALQQGGLY